MFGINVNKADKELNFIKNQWLNFMGLLIFYFIFLYSLFFMKSNINKNNLISNLLYKFKLNCV